MDVLNLKPWLLDGESAKYITSNRPWLHTCKFEGGIRECMCAMKEPTLVSLGVPAMLQKGLPWALVLLSALLLVTMPEQVQEESLDLVEIFAGVASIARAARKLGMLAVAMDISYHDDHDILSHKGFTLVPQSLSCSNSCQQARGRLGFGEWVHGCAVAIEAGLQVRPDDETTRCAMDGTGVRKRGTFMLSAISQILLVSCPPRLGLDQQIHLQKINLGTVGGRVAAVCSGG